MSFILNKSWVRLPVEQALPRPSDGKFTIYYGGAGTRGWYRLAREWRDRDGVIAKRTRHATSSRRAIAMAWAWYMYEEEIWEEISNKLRRDATAIADAQIRIAKEQGWSL